MIPHRRLPRCIWLPAKQLAAIVALLGCFAAAPARATPVEDHGAYFETLFAALMEEHGIPGLAVVLVQDGRVVFQAGYGWANVGRQKRIDPVETIFPLGSVSQLLTTVAVLQQVEQNAIDLDTNIERYIAPLHVDRRFPEPVTLRHILTHTDGFDVRWLFGNAARVPERVRSLPELLSDLPPRAMPPGETYLYGDVGMTLAGYAVERTAQLPFAAYMEQHVFEPLGMTRSSFRSHREAYARDRATGYEHGYDGQLYPVPVVYPHATPASGLTAPVADMAPLMIALLNAEIPGKPRILGTKSLEDMWRKQFAHHPALPGTGYGVYEFVHHGRRAMVHGGLLPGFTTLMALLPEAGVGLCVAANRFDLIDPLETTLLRNLLDRFSPNPAAASLPRNKAEVATRNAPTADATQFTGVYRCDQYSRFSADKLFVLAGMASELRVVPQSDGSLKLYPGEGRWNEIEPLVFENDLNGERIAFRTDAHDLATRIVGSAQLMSYHRVGPRDNIALHAGVGGLLLLLSGAAGVYAVRTGWRSPPAPFAPARMAARALRFLAVALPVGWTVFGLGLSTALRKLDFATAAFGEPASVAFLRGLPAVIGLAAIALLVVSIISLRTRPVPRSEALVYAAAALATLLLLPLLAQWQLVRAPSLVLSSLLP